MTSQAPPISHEETKKKLLAKIEKQKNLERKIREETILNFETLKEKLDLERSKIISLKQEINKLQTEILEEHDLVETRQKKIQKTIAENNDLQNNSATFIETIQSQFGLQSDIPSTLSKLKQMKESLAAVKEPSNEVLKIWIAFHRSILPSDLNLADTKLKMFFASVGNVFRAATWSEKDRPLLEMFIRGMVQQAIELGSKKFESSATHSPYLPHDLPRCVKLLD
jgi:hypothetical protein